MRAISAPWVLVGVTLRDNGQGREAANAGLTLDVNGDNRTLYSLRNTYGRAGDVARRGGASIHSANKWATVQQ